MQVHRAAHGAAAVLLGVGLCCPASPAAQERRVSVPVAGAPTTCETVEDPAVLQARNGALSGTLTMQPDSFDISGLAYETNVYNGDFLAPTLRLAPGDSVTLDVVNAMRPTASQPDSAIAWTNQHYHGLVVTPLPPYGDNVINVQIDRGSSAYHYSFPIPAHHAQGMFWYHPHPHGLTNPQVAGGLSGALLVGSVLTYFPQYQGVGERVLLVRDMSFKIGPTAALNVNGALCARLPVAPGESQLWHIGNMGANTFLNLKLAGRQWTVLALDGNPLPAARQMDSLFLAPGSRAEVIVTGPVAGDSVELFTDSFVTGPGSRTPRARLGWLVTKSGPGAASPSPEVRTAGAPDRALINSIRVLREATDVNRDTIVYSFTEEGAATLNGKVYSLTRLDVAVPWGQVQEWTLINAVTTLHTFHIHQTDFLVTEVNGIPQTDSIWIDNVPLGVHQGKNSIVGDTVTVRFAFDSIAAGPFVFHCHVLAHEDEGMMQNICVYDPKDPNGPENCKQKWFSQASGHGHAQGQGHGARRTPRPRQRH